MRPLPILHAAFVAALVLSVAAASAQTSQKRARRAPPPSAAPVLSLPVAPGEQLAAAALAFFGDYACEFNEVINVDIDRKFDGYVDVRHRHQSWIMKPVLSHTGALRLEDVKGRMLLLQIANKSMLMDTQIGQRVVDNCVHERQREAARGPAGESLGIEPAKAVAVSASAPAPSK